MSNLDKIVTKQDLFHFEGGGEHVKFVIAASSENTTAYQSWAYISEHDYRFHATSNKHTQNMLTS